MTSAQPTLPRRVAFVRPPASQSGFTLLELLVAVLVLAMIVSTAYGALRMGVRSWEAGISQATKTEAMRTTADLLRRQLGQLVSLKWTVADEQRISFDGTADRIRFIATVPQHGSQAGLYEFSLQAERGTDGVRLALSYAPFFPGREEFSTSGPDKQVILVDELATAGFEYFGTPRGAELPGWQTEWSTTEELPPRLVRIQLDHGADQPQWPGLVLAIRAGEPL